MDDESILEIIGNGATDSILGLRCDVQAIGPEAEANLIRARQRAGLISNFILEAQFESVDSQKLLTPRSTNNRIYPDMVIPEPNPLTILAWESICELMSAAIHPSWAGSLATSWAPQAQLPPDAEEHRFVYWGVVQIPTLGDGHSETSIEGAILPSTNIIKEEGGYGFWAQFILTAEVTPDGGFKWTRAYFNEEWEDTGVMAVNNILRCLRRTFPHRQYINRVVNQHVSWWSRGTRTRKNAAPAAFLNSVRDKAFGFDPPAGCDPMLPSHQHFYRIFRDHGIGMRFTSTPNKWLDGWQEAIEARIIYQILSFPSLARFYPAELVHRVRNEYGTLFNVYNKIESSMAKWNKSSGQLDTYALNKNMTQVNDILGL
jgi:hypothetical protein